MPSILGHVRQRPRFVVLLVGVAALVVEGGWTGAALAPIAVLLFVMDERRVDDDAMCHKCAHRKDDHNGNCQECLRLLVRGDLARDVPCSRFGRKADGSRSSRHETHHDAMGR